MLVTLRSPKLQHKNQQKYGQLAYFLRTCESWSNIRSYLYQLRKGKIETRFEKG
jgi:hypothetical protein